MRSALYVGRVGALAVALGIGAVIAGVPGIAWAGPDGESDAGDPPGMSAPSQPDDPKGAAGDPSDSDLDTGPADEGDPGDGSDTGDAGDADGTKVSGGGMKIGNSGGAKSNKKDKDGDIDPPKRRSIIKPGNIFAAPSSVKTASQPAAKALATAKPKAKPQPVTVKIAPPADPGPQLRQAAGSPAGVAPPALKASSPQQQVVTTMTAVTKSLPQPSVSRVLSFVTLSPDSDGKEPATTESPLLSVFLAGGRRASQRAVVSDADARIPAAQPQQSSQLLATTSSAPSSFSLRSLFLRDTTKPTVSLTAPSGPVAGTVALSATASDNVGGQQREVLCRQHNSRH